MERVHLIIVGDVQGVGFRSWTLRQATSLNLTGWVKNRPDKAVEVIAEGEKESLEVFVERCGKGPEVAWVENVDVQWVKATGEFVSFSVVY